MIFFVFFAVFVFLSTPSARRATLTLKAWERVQMISIHALREESDLQNAMQTINTAKISIHALREESDEPLVPHFAVCPISIHALREESDGRLTTRARPLHRFLSTPSARRATWLCFLPLVLSLLFLSTPSARRATILWDNFKHFMGISIHALREESDFANLGEQPVKKKISIHALREESDCTPRSDLSAGPYFYPRPPRGERPVCAIHTNGPKTNFYPRPPRGERPPRSRWPRL